jgi:hypothetical protein
MFLYLPRGRRDAIADEANVPRICDLNQPGTAANDAKTFSFGSLLPALTYPDQAIRLFVDHVLLAAGVDNAQTHGGMRPVSRLVLGGRAPPAGATSEGDRRQSRWRAGQGAGAGMPVIKRPVFASVSPFLGNGGAQQAI